MCVVYEYSTRHFSIQRLFRPLGPSLMKSARFSSVYVERGTEVREKGQFLCRKSDGQHIYC